MKRHLVPLASIVLAAVAASTAVHAADAGSEPRVEVTAPRADLGAAQAVLATRGFDATYGMSTGRPLAVSSIGESLRVRYGRRAPATLRHDGQGSFVSADGRLVLSFELDRHGEPQLVRLSLPAAWL